MDTINRLIASMGQARTDLTAIFSGLTGVPAGSQIVSDASLASLESAWLAIAGDIAAHKPPAPVV